MILAESGHAARLFESLVELSPAGMFAIDCDYRYLLWNPAMETISGLRAEQVLGRTAFEVFPSLHESGADAGIREALSGRSALLTTHVPFLRSPGDGHYETRYFPLKSAAGEVLGAVAVLAETSEHEAAERRISETESRFKNMADASPVLLWMSRSDGLCTFFNQTWLDFTGRSMDEEWGVGWAEGVHFEDFQRCMDTYLEAFNQRRLFEMEYRLRRKDGEFRWILDRGTPRYLPDGTFAGYIGSCVDITEHKRLEAELRNAVRARDEFISVASHELRTPIAALQLQLEVLQRTLERSEEAPDLAKLSQRAGKALDKTLYLGNMVNVLLDASRLSENRLQLDFEDVELAVVLREVVEHLREPAQQAGSLLELALEAEPVGRWDRFRIAQVVTNLLENALKYGGGKPVRVLCSERSGRARIDVIDQGPGVPPECRPALFTRFARIATPRAYGGFGLGLWIAREIVKAHGGQIDLEGATDSGAHFFVELPALAR
ncbi:MAG TPA: PAS domain S-box protein [Polyangiaceae bacterium]|nr:PAS domain S-box protein [Polyangiaceae bacterium]